MRTKLAFIGGNSLEAVEADTQFCVDHGFEGLEYNFWGNIEQLDRATVEAMREIHAAQGVKCAMFGIWGWNYLSKDTDERAKANAMLKRTIEFGRILEAEVLTTGGGMFSDDLDENVAEFAKVFPPHLEAIQTAGMAPSFYAIHSNSFFASVQAYEKVWGTFPEVGIKFDPANWQHHGDDYLGVVRQYGNKITHLHIKEHLSHGGGVWRANPRREWETSSGEKCSLFSMNMITAVPYPLNHTVLSGPGESSARKCCYSPSDTFSSSSSEVATSTSQLRPSNQPPAPRSPVGARDRESYCPHRKPGSQGRSRSSGSPDGSISPWRSRISACGRV